MIPWWSILIVIISSHDSSCQITMRTLSVGTGTSNWHQHVHQYHGTTSIYLILTSCWCQLRNIWTSTHEVNMISIMCLDNDHWQTHMVKKKVEQKIGLKNNLVWKSVWLDILNINVQHQFDVNSWCQFDVDSCYHKPFIVDVWLMVSGHQLLTSE